MSEKVYVIVNVETGEELQTHNEPKGFKTPTAAKMAFNRHLKWRKGGISELGLCMINEKIKGKMCSRYPSFNEQKIYDVREKLTPIGEKVKYMTTLLREAYRCGVGSEELYAEIRGFLKGLK